MKGFIRMMKCLRSQAVCASSLLRATGMTDNAESPAADLAVRLIQTVLQENTELQAEISPLMTDILAALRQDGLISPAEFNSKSSL